MYEQVNALSKASIYRTLELLGALFVVALVIALGAGLILGILWGEAVGIATGALAVLSVALYGAWMIVQVLLDVRHNIFTASAALVDAENARTGKVQAEADAIRGAQVVNLNTGNGTQKNVNKPVIYRVNGQIVKGNQYLQVNQTDQPRKIEIPASDVVWISEQLPVIGHTKEVWLGKKLPYSGITINYLLYRTVVVDPLVTEKNPAIVGRGPRASGDLVIDQPKALVKYVEQAYPGALTKGITLEIPARVDSTRQTSGS